MSRYQLSNGNRIVASADFIAAHYPDAVPLPDDPDIAESDQAMAELAALDAKTGMSRMMRETLIAIAGNAAPKSLKDVEASASALRVKVKK